MHRLVLVVALSSLALAGCRKFESDHATSVTDKQVSESVNYADPAEQTAFEDAIKAAGITHSIEVRDGKRYVTWPAAQAEAVHSVERSLFSDPLPPGRNLSVSEDLREEFKSWMSENSIPYTVQKSRGREFFVWEEKHTQKVQTWKYFPPPVKATAPNPSIPSSGQLSASRQLPLMSNVRCH
jgi:hypothetical protein